MQAITTPSVAVICFCFWKNSANKNSQKNNSRTHQEVYYCYESYEKWERALLQSLFNMSDPNLDAIDQNLDAVIKIQPTSTKNLATGHPPPTRKSRKVGAEPGGVAGEDELCIQSLREKSKVNFQYLERCPPTLKIKITMRDVSTLNYWFHNYGAAIE